MPVPTSKNADQNFIQLCGWKVMNSALLTPVPPACGRLRQGSGQLTARDGSEVVLRLNRSLAEAFSSIQQLQQQHWLNHR